MPRAQTEQFGEIEYVEESALLFPRGLPGFESCRTFVLIEEAQRSPLVHLQSLECSGVCFLALPVRCIEPDYETALSGEDAETLGRSRSTLDLALLAVTADGRLTANLLAPVVIDLTTRRAVQAVRSDTLYSHQHEIAGSAACS